MFTLACRLAITSFNLTLSCFSSSTRNLSSLISRSLLPIIFAVSSCLLNRKWYSHFACQLRFWNIILIKYLVSSASLCWESVGNWARCNITDLLAMSKPAFVVVFQLQFPDSLLISVIPALAHEPTPCNCRRANGLLSPGYKNKCHIFSNKRSWSIIVQRVSVGWAIIF